MLKPFKREQNNPKRDDSKRDDSKREIWQFQEAKAKLSEVLNRVEEQGEQVIVRNRNTYFVILTEKKYRDCCEAKSSIMDIFLRCPYPEIDLVIERSKETLRDIEL